MKTKLLTFIAALCCISSLWAQNNVITYTASAKLTETTSSSSSGLHTNAFNVSIASHTFNDGVGTITFSGDVTSIGYFAFYGCSGLTSITIPNSVTSIEMYAFADCSGLTSITIPNSVTSIGYGAFYYVNNIVYSGTATGSPWGAKSVNGYVDGWLVYESAAKTNLLGCSSAATGEISIPNSVTSIGERAFSGCIGFKSINVENGNTHYSSVDGVLFNYAKDTLIKYPASNSSTSYTIPNSVTSIGIYAFSYCSGLKSITIPDRVTSIGEWAFYNCSGLTYITIPNSVTSIGERAFYNCTKLDTICFEGLTPPTFGSKWNDNCPLNNYFVPCGKADIYADAGIIATDIFGCVTHDMVVTSANPSKGTVRVVNEVNKFNNKATIAATPYYGYVFDNWEDGSTDTLREVIVISDTTFIAYFRNDGGKCGDNLKWQIDITTGILSIYGSGDMADYTAAKETPWYIYKDSITKIDLHNGITHIGNHAFEGCTTLKELTTPNTLESIGEYAFNGCSYLKTINLNTKVSTLGKYAFGECNKLFYVYCYGEDAPITQQTAFSNYNVYLYVPCEYKDNYRLDVVFGNFKYLECIGADEKEVDEPETKPTDNSVVIDWPAANNGDTYTIEIRKEGTLVCTLTFNANGQLMSINFAAPARGDHRAQVATKTSTGWSYTITGLDAGSNYTYTIVAKDKGGNQLYSESGTFQTTGGATALDQLTDSTIDRFSKIIKDGHLYILRGDKKYTMQGAEVK